MNRSKIKSVSLSIMATFYCFTGVAHLVRPDLFVKIVPPFLPFPFFIAIASGLVEIALGLGLLSARTRQKAAWGVIALLVAVFPANVYMYILRDTTFADLPAWTLLLRLPLQGVLILWAYGFTKRHWSSRPGLPPV